MEPRRDRHADLTTEAIADVVDRFYGRVPQDPVLGPIFARHIDDWTPHLLRMKAFWRSVLLRTGEFQRSHRGSPPVLHAAIGGLQADHFARWLTLFSSVLDETLQEAPAAMWKDRAQNIGDSLLRYVSEASPAVVSG